MAIDGLGKERCDIAIETLKRQTINQRRNLHHLVHGTGSIHRVCHANRIGRKDAEGRLYHTEQEE